MGIDSATGHDSFIPYSGPELLDILRAITTDINEVPIDDSINTTYLCRDILKCQFEITEVVFDALRARSHVAARILSRSNVEYFVDLAFLSTQNSDKQNRLFANHAILRRYWYVPRLRDGTYKDLAPGVVEQYREYVMKEFPDVAQKVGEGRNESSSWKDIDSKMRRTYQRHFTGLTFQQRVQKVVQRLPKSETVMDALLTAYALYSCYTHPSPYSVSRYSLEPGDNWCPVPKADYQYFNYELELYRLSNFAVYLFTLTLPSPQRQEIYQEFQRLVDKSPRVSQLDRASFSRE